MGCMNFKREGKETYVECDFVEEAEFRSFEDMIGCQKITFNSILPKVCIEKDLITIETAENFILKDFSSKFKDALKVEFFLKEFSDKKYYDAKKLKLLLFLITLESQVQVKKTYYDKVKSLFI